ncbi:Transcriptional regulator GntR family protein [Sphingobium herbicidovorans NBRC 16415]|uniref:Transcriptional regulator GntR family protein n=1 Tax=Sphingobium herbicidovorans (strain ATCC 700291 / DSM 11019 / CCUG 56400 / KCTC 2939 / LMG 18315 / NBRC 16415 / MH) TaxID=1219045 RepID=A0A086PEV8_SPHHM|nr:FadR/GntR family transcriptional regulator [Sphingobium herbicidovorans]KFG91926.1 Transcriptional regulator GntR family protein [Sphingobium herbicidovorans NBRC 16415]
MTTECAAIATEPETSGYRRVLEHLRDLLVNGGVETGQRLPSERELALSLGVSRPAVREAVRAMEMIGVLETRHGRASTVRVPDASVLGEFFSLALAQQPAIIEDIVEVRIALERQALRLACTRATPEDQRNLEGALEEIEATIDDVSSGGHADLHFHTQLVAAAHSPALSTVYGTITHLLERSHVERRRRIANSPKARDYLVDHHRKIYEAVRSGDASTADDLILSHFAIGAAWKMQGTAAAD